MPVDAADAELVTKMLKRWAGWDRVPDEVIGQLCTVAELLDVKRKRSLFRRGEPGPGLFLVKSGEFKREPPFEDTYPASGLFFKAVLGDGVEEALKYFREQAEAAPADEVGSG